MEDRGAFLISQSVCALITAMGMQAENDQRKQCNESMAYTEEAFQKIILDHQIGYNDAIRPQPNQELPEIASRDEIERGRLKGVKRWILNMRVKGSWKMKKGEDARGLNLMSKNLNGGRKDGVENWKRI